MAPKQPDPHQIIEQLSELMGNIFEQAQASVANHKKNCVALYKIHARLAELVEPGKKNKDAIRYVGERAFQDAFIDMVNRVLIVKRGVGNADRVVKYVGSFVKFMNEKVNEAKVNAASSSSSTSGGPRSIPGANKEDEDDEENATTRFVAKLLNYLLQGLVAKNKIVRFRCIHFISEMISHLGEIDEDTYTELRDQLIDRLNDKETYVRAHAVIALSKLVGSEDQDEMEDGEQTILQTLLEAIATDPAAEVRRAALVNVPLTANTLDAVLSRTRDVDAVTRKLVYAGVLQPKLNHPRQLSIAQREQIVKDGLGDREPGVRVAAGKLVASWFETMVAELGKGNGKKDEEEEGRDLAAEMKWDGDDSGVMKGLAKFLGLFDVIGPGESVAVEAVLAVFITRPELPDVFIFPDDYWRELTPESAVLARTFVEHCMSSKNEARLESAELPVVTAFAFHIQESYNQLLEILQEMETARILRAGMEDESDEELEEELAKREVVMGELLRIALKLDYADEIGRRKVFSVVKDMLAHPQLPSGLIDKCLDVLKEIMPSERDLIRMIVEIIVELREGENENEGGENGEDAQIPDDQSDISQATIRKDKSMRKKSREDMSAQERMQTDLTDIRCLMLCISVLERVNGSFEDNSTLEGILGDLIIPSVKRKELAMREKALVSLGLCCLIAKNMALSSFQLFMSQAQNAPPELKMQVLKIILDLLIMYPQEFFGRSDDISKRIVDFLLQALEGEESPPVQAILCTGICKLLLAGIITDSRVLTCIALMYVSPSTSENQELRQCLSYFFPVYAYSSPTNQNRVQEVFMPTFDLALRMYEDLENGQTMITPHQFGLLMVDWTNPEKAAEIFTDIDKSELKPTHANLAVSILVALYDSDRGVDEQKTLCQLLSQLHIEAGLDTRSIHKLNILLTNHEDQSPFDNTAVEKIFDKFKSRLTKLFEKELKEIDPREFVDDEFRDLYQKIGVDVPGEDEGRRGRKSKAKKNRKKVMDEDEEEEEEEEEIEAEAEEEAEEVTRDEDEETEVPEAASGDEGSKHEDDEMSAATAFPPPPQRLGSKRATRAAKPTKAKKAKEAVASTDVDTQASDEENIPPSPTVSATPTKKKGVKRLHTPSAGLDSPANRKKTRVKAPPKMGQEATPTNSDVESPTTPTKPSRTTKGRAAAARPSRKAAAKKKAATPVSEEDEDDEDEVASTLAVSPRASSSDFGGYSD